MKPSRFLIAFAILSSPVNANPNTATAILAGGCYWGMQEVFEHVKGVNRVVAGFAGPTSNHAEAVKIIFDPTKVSYNQLLDVYFNVAHDPTQVGRQGPDVGPSYRSAIFPESPEQAQAARAYIAQLSAKRAFGGPITTRIEQGPFSAVGPDQQDFARSHPDLPYIVAVDVPKVRNLRKSFPQLWRS